MTASTARDVFADRERLEALAAKVGTPFYLFDAAEIRRRADDVTAAVDAPSLRARYAMKACSTRHVLEELRARDIWIDAVSGNEVLRALRAGYAAGSSPPAILLTADVFRDNALQVVREHGVLVTIGTPQMVDELQGAGVRGPVGLRLNPGFGHGHVKQCDTGGPASKHGVWHEEGEKIRARIERAGLRVTLLHAHIGTGPAIAEFEQNVRRLADFFAERVGSFPDLEAVSFGGGIPHPYRPGAKPIDLATSSAVLRESQTRLSAAAGRDLRVEIEPGRYLVAGGAALVTRVRGRKETRSNEKGAGNTFVLVDAGFCDLVRPAMYGSYHRIEIPGKQGGEEPQVLAGPLCESGDVFTRDAEELIEPRMLPRAEVGDLVLLRDAGAYGASMSSNYNSIGRVPQVWVDGDTAHLMSRRETLEDITRTECFDAL